MKPTILQFYGIGILCLIGAGVNAAESLDGQAREVLQKATAFVRAISTEGGYLWQYSEDLTERWGENQATATQIWVQPPGTPTMGTAFLRAYAVTMDEQYLQAAQAAALALVRGQLQSGGWDYRIDFAPTKGQQSYRKSDQGKLTATEAATRRNVTNFDDDNSQSALRFLMEFVQAPGMRTGPAVQEIRQALEYGLAKMVEAQYPNGAWPQRYDGKPRDPAKFPIRPARIPEHYPREHPKTDYAAFYTLNDHTQSDCIRTMLHAYKQFGRPEYLAAAKKGGDFLILAQLPEPQSAWAQQYNFDLEPAWARAFEPPAVCSGESAGAIRTLVDLYLEAGDAKFLKPIPAAIDWFKRSQIAAGTWSRFYELGTNKPIYGDRDGKIHYTLEEISEERQRGYAWRGSFRVPETIALFDEVRKANREAYLTRRAQEQAAAEKRRSPSDAEVHRIIDGLDRQGRWLTNNRIETRVFVRNVHALCDYLARTK